MRSPAKIQREAKEMSETVCEALRKAVERNGVELKELSAQVGRADGYFSHLFKGRITLTAEHIFTVLLALDLSPAEFFSQLYGQKVPGGVLAEDDFDARVLRAMERYGLKPRLREDDLEVL